MERWIAAAGGRLPAGATSVALWFVGIPLGLNLATMVFFGLDADSSAEMLFVLLFTAVTVGAAFSQKGLPLPAAVAAAAWAPALLVGYRWYWALGLHSPGGAAQWAVALAGWKDAPAGEAAAAAAAAGAVPGWLLMRFDRWYERKTGRSLFDED